MVDSQHERIGVAILGSTGSIGRSTLSVIKRHSDIFRVVALSANNSVEDLARQTQEHSVPKAVVADSTALNDQKDLPDAEWKSGPDAILEVVSDPEVDVVVNAIVGSVGLAATLASLEADKKLALANKESLVAGGPLVIEQLRRGKGELIPIDSEHSGVFQCLRGEELEAVSRLILTASGGPFRTLTEKDLKVVTLEEALIHPTWSMGQKVTIDSATLANKALEIIEAHFLFDVDYEHISAVIHPQSIVHSFVEFVDGSILAQLGFPTMELPILYALTYPGRLSDPDLRTFDPSSSPSLDFENIDEEQFPVFCLGVESGIRGGNAPTVFNAANEIAVEAFVDRQIKFTEISLIVEETLISSSMHELNTIDDVFEADRSARELAKEVVELL
ncbi:MAG TPA: 1-deoxy-D-xylulose-5-phosphate reductoisomerase [Gemmatimonadetes bacterium]|jgi:1-deoxy-D-xylulose-5-phosphate reductoisomerase|nr:1-deoxy-D-xylulose-5-phosphate reductoisomerase [Gemmatimonadota bacterium]